MPPAEDHEFLEQKWSESIWENFNHDSFRESRNCISLNSLRNRVSEIKVVWKQAIGGIVILFISQSSCAGRDGGSTTQQRITNSTTAVHRSWQACCKISNCFAEQNSSYASSRHIHVYRSHGRPLVSRSWVRVSSVSLFWRMRSLKQREQVLCSLGGVGITERATTAVIIMWSGGADAGNVRDCGIISAALYLVTSNYYNVTPPCGAATHQAAALTCYWSRTAADFETKLLSKMLF